jgi:protein gp37
LIIISGKYWTEQINPVSGCTPISEACANCYARELHERFRAAAKPVEFYSKPFSEIVLRPEQLSKFDKLARMKEPQVVFVGNMCDLFHEKVPDDYLYEIFNQIESLREFKVQHTFLFLTKRAKRMLDFITAFNKEILETTEGGFPGEFPNVWLGVTAENQQRADERIPYLLETPAAHKWISVEPMLGPMDLLKYNGTVEDLNRCCCAGPKKECKACPYDGHGFDLVIAGGESGRKSRPTQWTWFEDLYHQCRMSGARFYLKHLGDAYTGERVEIGNDAYMQPFIVKVSS